MNKWWYVPGDASSLAHDILDKIPKTRDRSGGTLHIKLDPLTKEELPYSIDEIEEHYSQHYGFNLPSAFDIIRSITPTVSRSFPIYDCKKNQLENISIRQ